jgi:transcriptional regulator with XRE-family HTH domain
LLARDAVLRYIRIAYIGQARQEADTKTASTLIGEMPRKVEATSEFGRRLVELRRARGLTQTQLAEAIGSSQRAISSYETVAEFPPAAVVVELARALQVTTDELFGLRPLRPANGHDDPATRRLWKKFQQVAALPEKDRRAVIRLVNSLVESKASRSAQSGGSR